MTSATVTVEQIGELASAVFPDDNDGMIATRDTAALIVPDDGPLGFLLSGVYGSLIAATYFVRDFPDLKELEVDLTYEDTLIQVKVIDPEFYEWLIKSIIRDGFFAIVTGLEQPVGGAMLLTVNEETYVVG